MGERIEWVILKVEVDQLKLWGIYFFIEHRYERKQHESYHEDPKSDTGKATVQGLVLTLALVG